MTYRTAPRTRATLASAPTEGSHAPRGGYPSRSKGEEACRFGWHAVPCEVRGIDELDETYLQLVADLQRIEFATKYRRANTAVPMWASVVRRRAVSLARVAIEAHERAADQTQKLSEESHPLSGRALAERMDRTFARLRQLLAWVPAARHRHLLGLPPWFDEGSVPLSLAEIVEHLELPHVAYLALTVRDWRAAEDGVREYVHLAAEGDELDREHRRRWRPELLPGLAALVLAVGRWPAADEELALATLESGFPHAEIRRGKFGGEKLDRREDFPQDLLLHIARLARELGRQPGADLMGRLYDGDPMLTLLANAATKDFLNERARELRREKIAPTSHTAELLEALNRCGKNEGDGLSEDEGLSSLTSETDHPMGGPGSRFPAPDAEVTRRLSRDRLEDKVLRVFRHTPNERVILRCLLDADDIDPRDRGFVNSLAARVGCSREAVSRYLSELREHKPSIYRALLE